MASIPPVISGVPRTGAIPSPHGVLDAGGNPLASDFANSRLLVGVGASITKRAIDLFPFHTTRVQKRQNCVSHAFVNTGQVLAGVRLGRPLTAAEIWSVDYSYAGAQHLYSPGEFPDTGSSCALTLKWWRDHGVVLETDYPEVDNNGVQLPPDDLWQEGAGATVTGCHRIADGAGAPDLIDAALALAEQGICSAPNIVVTADAKMFAIGAEGIYDSPGGAVAGGHSLAVLSSRPDLGPTGAYGVGDTWGFYRWYVTREYVAKYTREKYVMEASTSGVVR